MTAINPAAASDAWHVSRAEDPDQLDIDAELVAQEGLDEWMRGLPCPPWRTN
jgi:hypothetical protein